MRGSPGSMRGLGTGCLEGETSPARVRATQNRGSLLGILGRGVLLPLDARSIIGMVSTTTQGAEGRMRAVRRLVTLIEAVGAFGLMLVSVMCSRTHKAPVGTLASSGEVSQ